MRTTHYSALPPTVSYPQLLSLGKKEAQLQSENLQTDTDSRNTWDFALEEAAHQGFRNDIHTCILSMQPDPECVCVHVLIAVRE